MQYKSSCDDDDDDYGNYAVHVIGQVEREIRLSGLMTVACADFDYFVVCFVHRKLDLKC